MENTIDLLKDLNLGQLIAMAGMMDGKIEQLNDKLTKKFEEIDVKLNKISKINLMENIPIEVEGIINIKNEKIKNEDVFYSEYALFNPLDSSEREQAEDYLILWKKFILKRFPDHIYIEESFSEKMFEESKIHSLALKIKLKPTIS